MQTTKARVTNHAIKHSFSTAVRIHPLRSGRAATRKPSGSLVAWASTDLGLYLSESRHLAVLDNGEDEGDGWSSSLIQRYKFESTGRFLVSTEHSRYMVELLPEITQNAAGHE